MCERGLKPRILVFSRRRAPLFHGAAKISRRTKGSHAYSKPRTNFWLIVADT